MKQREIQYALYESGFVGQFMYFCELPLTCQDSGVHRWRPASRKLSLTICQASSTIPSLVTVWGPVISSSFSSWRHCSVKGLEGDCSCKGDSAASENGEDSKMFKERAPLKAPSRVFLTQLLLVVRRIGDFLVGVGGDGDDRRSEDEELQSKILIFCSWFHCFGWLKAFGVFFGCGRLYV